MKLSDILNEVDTLETRGPLDREVQGLAYDSRAVRRGFLFVALRGEHDDGIRFADEALAAGAVAIISEHREFQRREVTHAVVADARRALFQAAGAFHGHPSRRLKVVGITGTNGKTTTAFMLRDILAAAHHSPGLIGTVQYEVGQRIIPAGRTTPEAPDIEALLHQMKQAGCRAAVMEVSSHSLAQQRVSGLSFDAAVFTNLTRDHLDYHGTMERYFEAKCLLFDQLAAGEKKATAVLPADDPWGRQLLERCVARGLAVVTYGFSAEAQVRGEGLAADGTGIRLHAQTPWGVTDLRLALPGRFNAANALAALAAGGALGVGPAVAAEALRGLLLVPGRLEAVPTGRDFQVYVDYAHTDDALANVLGTLREFTARRLIVVFGCGGNRDRAKRPLMGAVAARLADHTILTSDNPRKEPPGRIIEEIRAGMPPDASCDICEDRAAAIRLALETARAGDVVLIAGKGHERTQEFASTIVPFDDRQAVRQALQGMEAK